MKEAAYKIHCLQEELEKVQNHAARLVTGNYMYVFETGSMTGIIGQLKRRKDSSLIPRGGTLKFAVYIGEADFLGSKF